MRLFTIATLGVLVTTSMANSGCGAMMAKLTHADADEVPANAFMKSQSQQGKIVFSTKEIPRDVASADGLATEFTLDQTIWWRPFYAHSPYNAILAAGKKCYDDHNHDYIVDVRNADGPADQWERLHLDTQSFADPSYVNGITMAREPLLGTPPESTA